MQNFANVNQLIHVKCAEKSDASCENARSVFKTKEELCSSPAVFFLWQILQVCFLGGMQSQRKNKLLINSCSIKDQSCVCWAAKWRRGKLSVQAQVDKSSFYCWVLLEERSRDPSLSTSLFLQVRCVFSVLSSTQHFLFSRLHVLLFLLFCSLHDWCLNFKTCTWDHLYVCKHPHCTNKWCELIYVKSFKEDGGCSLFSWSECSVKYF